MSFVASLLHRELAAPSRAAGTPAAATFSAGIISAGTPSAGGSTPDGAVVPRLASRFEDSGAPLWPGSGTEGGASESEVETWAEPAGATDVATPAAGQPGPVPAAPGPAAPHPLGAPARRLAAASRPDSVVPPGRRDAQPQTGPAPRHGPEPAALAVDPAQFAALPAPLPAVRPAAAAPDGGLSQGDASQPARRPGVVQGEMAARPGPGRQTPARREPPAQTGARDAGALRPRLETLMRREPSRAPEQHIHVHIGRIEVKAVAAPPAPQRVAGSEQTGLMSLDEYLQGRP